MPEQLSLHDQLHVRLEEKLRRELGSAVLEALADPCVIEIMLNPDGRLWIDELGVGMRDTGVLVSRAAQAENLLGTMAAMLGCVITPERPILEGELPLDGSRFCGFSRRWCWRPRSASANQRRSYIRSTITCATAFSMASIPADVLKHRRPPERGHAAALALRGPHAAKHSGCRRDTKR